MKYLTLCFSSPFFFSGFENVLPQRQLPTMHTPPPPRGCGRHPCPLIRGIELLEHQICPRDTRSEGFLGGRGARQEGRLGRER